jgi:hypothetical protein
MERVGLDQLTLLPEIVEVTLLQEPMAVETRQDSYQTQYNTLKMLRPKILRG